ncbi:hypothetical protein AB0L42_29255 [Streptomyces sp. NPDC052287]|uniref:hypothetical protein n=1 Tax=Streptomyces sp. NPDC052287 TaxID=3154950 RepID=UPI003445B439
MLTVEADPARVEMRLVAGGVALATYADVVREQRGQCERHRGSDEQCAGPLTY